MSILVVEVLPEGIVFAADRNVTASSPNPSNPAQSLPLRQTQHRKVFRWPNGRALLGYVGAATIGGEPNDIWFQRYIDNHLDFASLESLGRDLCQSVQNQRAHDEGTSPANPV